MISKKSRPLILSALCLCAYVPMCLYAGSELVTLTKRDGLQLTIYNQADLTLVRETRMLTLKKGVNRLEFSWAETAIDARSLDLRPLKHANQIDIQELKFSFRTGPSGVWGIRSEVSGKVPFEVTYFLSKVNWKAVHMVTMNADETAMQLQTYVRIDNYSGMDFTDAQTRVVVGEPNLMDDGLFAFGGAWRLSLLGLPFGVPDDPSLLSKYIGMKASFGAAPMEGGEEETAPVDVSDELAETDDVGAFSDNQAFYDLEKAKEVFKQNLSEYILYTIEGKESIKSGWGKRLVSLDVKEIPVTNLYKYDESRFKKEVHRFLYFTNDKDSKLGETPIPEGSFKVYRMQTDGHLSYEGGNVSSVDPESFDVADIADDLKEDFVDVESLPELGMAPPIPGWTKYVPVDGEAELPLGPVKNVLVKPKLMSTKTENVTFDHRGDVNGWDDLHEYKVTVKNTRPVAAKVEITRHLNHKVWELTRKGDFGKYEKVDLDTVKFTLELPAETTKEFTYVVRKYQGERQRRR